MIDFIITNWSVILSAFFGVIAIATIIVAATETTKDDVVLNWIINLLDKLSLAQTSENKKILEEAKAKMAEKAEVKK